MDNINKELFKHGSCVVSFKGSTLGATVDGPSFNIQPEYYESKCDQAGGRIIRKIITNLKINVAAEILEIDNTLRRIFDSDGKITGALIGTDLLNDGGELTLIPTCKQDKTGYRFPNAILLPEADYQFKSTEDHTMKVNFEIHENNDGVLMEKIACNS
ncbi:hypothetical protein P0136_01365 [Lentisphaerota bacterium ZTH]|nr:hypothetical protein JYG24_07495 [Lentisphaerota bacterium]WET06663.1 hypothetical protein P0136_01365 [Lentisphaerota bacterium ZTH]